MLLRHKGRRGKSGQEHQSILGCLRCVLTGTVLNATQPKVSTEDCDPSFLG